jgi:hypothetical protein
MRVLPEVLEELMRHASITTTLEYYVGREAEATADVIWAVSGDSFGDFRKSGDSRRERRKSKSSAKHDAN